MRHVVSVANVGQLNFLQIAEALLQGEVIGQRLAGMLQIAERVDHRNRRVLRHSRDRGMREGAQHDAVHPAFQIVRDVAQFFASVQAAVGLVDENGQTTETRHSGLEGDPRTQRRLLEEHHDLLARQHFAEIHRTALHQPG